MSSILIVEDDLKLAQLLQSYMEKYGYQAEAVREFDRVMETFQDIRPDLVLLDVNLPRYDGYYWCRQIRTVSTCPILFISARDGKMEQIMALENGADDYIAKPFDYEVVMAKIKSQLRRAYGSYAPSKRERIVECSGLVLYPERLELTLSGKTIDLSHKESLLMEILMESSSKVVSRDWLLDKLWDGEPLVDDNTLNVNITRIRKKLSELGIEEALETVRGAGYKLRPCWREEP
ncbi:DNA-binding response regulator, OmpR family, contains REC and winged-helix (wHTH) domain [Paenibacillus sp. UNCCL117]|uniref:response regulator transcription factor n=1 Tax=unclassified Paenibacillus TaxID=185978 RepID=UPI00088ED2D2|nr:MULTISPECIES: response regulator transcription factor [unclassified Paenibacillus]SDE15365.1 DNA-binding response regulator, OmpR family, contains REC and winged-helix (wHTH) domain [Paenibacillus sp. cl123]SFW60876.1 DNA-binding response regulator, OmpR family, contains REC and winged-helix (wHTH) domain [Paenibacillus sp. UNCCL117]